MSKQDVTPTGLHPHDERINAQSPSLPVRTVNQVRHDEQLLQQTFPNQQLVAWAGACAARWLQENGELVANAIIWVLAGPGHNGADAYVCARHLHNRGYTVRLFSLNPNSTATQLARAAWLQDGGQIETEFPPLASTLANERPSWILDGLFGIGLNRAPQGQAAQWISEVHVYQRVSQTRVLALDIPSGLDANNGNPHGENCLRADATLTFLSLKPGLLTGAAADYRGELWLASWPHSPDESDQINHPSEATQQARLNSLACFQALLPQRQANSHKGIAGTACLIGGADGMEGALLLAAQAALLSGAGKVYLQTLATQADTANLLMRMAQPELLGLPTGWSATLEHTLQHAQAIAIGPGLGQTTAAQQHLLALLQYRPGLARQIAHPNAPNTAPSASTDWQQRGLPPLILDADALNLLANHPAIRQALQQYSGSRILTPHPLEAARLLGCDVATVQADRLSAARLLARQYAAWIVLKGSGSVICGPDERVWINVTGNASLATAGTGDILTGTLSSLLAQGMSVLPAIQAAVWLHGYAAELAWADFAHSAAAQRPFTAPATRLGDRPFADSHRTQPSPTPNSAQGLRGLTATELGKFIRIALNQWLH
ncbi:NAD(P)H-hydrate dehydratase [Parvibium lacunae]|uniref:ADP-dependent (S)-NAD(P)H-hydrate dehydratase n=1 Tax=Parvibium lacunae TaxID=1888893 RepID=A0A368L862_9BURK|nr:NAD(P)H-hydrate dehydratase [Parvibium lacunae]RCS59797.1 NAD(P)H-hydrate dehydratase [Parvibium lacunae]